MFFFHFLEMHPIDFHGSCSNKEHQIHYEHFHTKELHSPSPDYSAEGRVLIHKMAIEHYVCKWANKWAAKCFFVVGVLNTKITVILF